MLEIIAEVMGFLAALPARAPILPDTELMEGGLIDSTGLVQLIMFLESRFGITVADADIVPETFATPTAIAAYVETRRA